MKRVEKILDVSIVIVGLTFIQLKAIELAMQTRMYFAIGGEYLVIPLIVLVWKYLKVLKRGWKKMKETKN